MPEAKTPKVSCPICGAQINSNGVWICHERQWFHWPCAVRAVDEHEKLTKIRDLAVQFAKDWYYSQGGIQLKPPVSPERRCERFTDAIFGLVDVELKT